LIWPGIRRHREVRDECVFRFAGAVRNHRRVIRAGRKPHRFEVSVRLPIWFTFTRIEFATLVDPLLPSAPNSSRTSRRRLLDLASQSVRKMFPAFPSSSAMPSSIRDNRILRRPFRPEIHHLFRRLLALVRLLEYVLFLVLIVELASRRIERDRICAPALVARFPDGSINTSSASSFDFKLGETRFVATAVE